MRLKPLAGIAALLMLSTACVAPEQPVETPAADVATAPPSEATKPPPTIPGPPAFKCSSVPKGKGTRGQRFQCPGDFETVWLTLVSCATPDWPDGIVVASPTLGEIGLLEPPYRVAWIVNVRKNYKWTLERKQATGKDIFPGPKHIDNPAFGAYYSDMPDNAVGGDVWEYKVVVTENNGTPCASLDPEIRVKDDPLPPGPPPK
jgi:hypothetical protein